MVLTSNPCPAGVLGGTERHRWGGGADLASLPRLTRERVAVARRARRQSKALNQYFLRKLKVYKRQVKGKNRHVSPHRLPKRD